MAKWFVEALERADTTAKLVMDKREREDLRARGELLDGVKEDEEVAVPNQDVCAQLDACRERCAKLSDTLRHFKQHTKAQQRELELGKEEQDRSNACLKSQETLSNTLKQELAEHKARAGRLLQEKDLRIDDLYGQLQALRDAADTEGQYEEQFKQIGEEKREWHEEQEKLRADLDTVWRENLALVAQLEALQHQHTTSETQLRSTVQCLEECQHQAREAKREAEEATRVAAEERRGLQLALLQREATLQEFERKLTLQQDSDLSRRLQSMSDMLVTKQQQLERLKGEKQDLIVQLGNRAEVELHHSIAIAEPPSKRKRPPWWGLARLLLLAYIAGLHIWVVVVLGAKQPEV
eukprot:NODE_2438_length_1177_cov_25.226667_g2323_i0.p1 GENE.NODE_2438_length_1177_cov_25.226667_g2323_i0~~NODE_2438_length_1177_cov_25.226667_g2323_i0.p1  ORF type:complete len:352 (-),score=132.72 NODE_2438_length_1177_cov_25.226667_g2323_i0:72-1127(-)